MPKVYKSQLIEVVSVGVSGGNQTTKIQFPDQPYLRNKAITSIEVVTSAEMSVSPSGRTPLSITEMQKCYLTLYLTDAQNPNNVGEWIQLAPFAILHRAQNSGSSTTSMPFVRQMFDLQSQVIYWEKCYISMGSALGNTSDVSFLLNVYFKN